MEKKIKKLVLNKEVIKRLNRTDLEQVAGASFKTVTQSCYTCLTCEIACTSVMDTADTSCG